MNSPQQRIQPTMKERPARAIRRAALALMALCALALGATAHAEDWSDTSISWRWGTQFAEPYNTKYVSKNIFALTHAGGYKYGTDFFNVDLLQSDSNDPGAGTGDGAQEAYVVYRNTLDAGKIIGKSLSAGPIRGAGLTLGFDWNSKNDGGYQSKKRMLVAGPTLMLNVPGFFNIDVLALNESNDPAGLGTRFTYTTHVAVGGEWGIPVYTLWKIPVSYEGFALWIAAKGTNEFGGPTAAETNIDTELMFDLSALFGAPAKTFRVGPEYQYWDAKFGNPDSIPGTIANTPMLRTDYHF
jgi:nucleoside-specific outer membrane channel protein Tsx